MISVRSHAWTYGKKTMRPRLAQVLLVLALMHQGTKAWSTRCGGSTNLKPWQPDWEKEVRDDLLCNSHFCPDPGPGFKPESIDVDKCCTCQSCMKWEGEEIELHVEYVSVLGKSIAISEQVPSNSSVYKIVERYSEMTEIPSNICNWDNETNLGELYDNHFQNMEIFWENLVTLDFTGSKIRKIPDINCLMRLDQLILSQNNIRSISNTSFTNLSRLRLINLEGNGLKSLEPNIFTSPNLNIFFALFGDNDLEKLDVTNMFSMYPFCSIDYSDNKINELVNENDFKLDMDKKYGPGFVTYQDNCLEAFPNFKDLLHLDSWQQMGALFSFGFDFRGVPIICDCNLEPFMSLAEDIKDMLWLDYMNVTCTGPPKHAGKSVASIPTDELVCPIPQHKGCPKPECTCVDKPKVDTLYINCSNQGLTELPLIPTSNHSQNLSLDVSGNQIQEIANMSYLPKLSFLNISHNDLKVINEQIAKQIENTTQLDISFNPKLRTLPDLFQSRYICNTTMRNLVITCNCETSWLETWIASSKCNNTEDNLFRCDIPKEGLTDARKFDVSELGCFLNTLFYVIGSMMAGVVLLLILTSASTYWYRYELLILYLRLRRRKPNAILPYKYDVFVSFNDNEEHVNKWIMKSLEPRLQKSGYNTFLAIKDSAYGAERNSQVTTAIRNSRNFLIILSDGYLVKADQGMRSWTENEWKFGWNNFKQDRGKNIVLVNFDHLEPSDIDDPIIKAYVRVGCTVDFMNHDRNIMEDIETKLGKPIRRYDINGKGNDNKKLKFPGVNLFIVSPYEDEVDDDDIILEDVTHDLNGNRGSIRFQHKPKLCKYRKCYACQQKQLGDYYM